MLDSSEQQIVNDVERFGWHITMVAPRIDSNDPDQWFAYTIGLPKTFGWPELICFGLSTSLMGNLLNSAVAELRHRHLTPRPGLVLHDVAEGFPVRLEANPLIPKNYFGFANWFASYSGMPMPEWLQLFWPDKQGRFPSEPDCVPEVVQLQTPAESE